MASEPVNVDNFVRAETHRMFAALQQQGGGINVMFHHREPASLDDQRVIRQNRDTLYSGALVDLSDGATLSIPDSGERYLSVMVVNEDHYINRIFHDPGSYDLTVEEFGTDYVRVTARILVDPNDPEDVAVVNGLQDQLTLTAASARPFASPDYDTASLDTIRAALLTLSRGVARLDRCFGKKEDVDPVRHLLGTAVGWGGLPEQEAFYLNIEPGLPVGRYELNVPPGPGRRVLVHLGLQRGRLLRAQEPRRGQPQQRDRNPRRGRVDHGPVRR